MQSVEHLRKWLAWSAVALLGVTTVSYYIARARVTEKLHNPPKLLGLDIQQTSDGFSLSKSEGGRTIYTIRASNAVQFKKGGTADLKSVHIVVYGRSHDRYDQIYGKEFTYDPTNGDVVGLGEVNIDLQGNAEGPAKPDQAPPAELRNPIHIVTQNLNFNQKTGQAHTDGIVQFSSLQASGTATGAYYDANTNQLELKSDVHVVTKGEKAADIVGSSAIIQRDPRPATLFNATIYQPDRTLTANKLTMQFEDDNSVKHAQAEGNVNIEARGTTIIDVSGPRGDLNMGPDNAVLQAIVSGGAKFNTRGDNLSHGSADTFILDFEADNQPKYLHMVKNARMHQDPQPGKPGSPGQPMEIAADQLNFVLENGNDLRTADTVGKAQITIFPAPAGSRAAKSTAKTAPTTTTDIGSSNSTTVATAGKFHATFGDGNRLRTLHGSPDARIVSLSPGQPDKVSTSQNLDVAFAPDGGAEKLVQSGDFQYHEPSSKPDTGGRAMFADTAIYNPADETLVLTGSPRAIDGGMTTTADVLRLDRKSGEAFADGSVKTTYSDLKPQPGGALLAASDPVHVTAEHMTSQQQPGVAHYRGNVRLWQAANVVRAPIMDFDQQNRTLTAHSDTAKSVSSLFVQQAADGKLTPIDVTADKLTYVDAERRARYSGGVLVKSPTGTVSSQQIDIYLKPADAGAPSTAASKSGAILPGSEGPSRLDHMVATGKVVVTEPNRRAVGDKLVYTDDDAKYFLTGKTASIFDAEHGQIWGDSLTFYSRDDRVLVESKAPLPTVTRARITK